MLCEVLESIVKKILLGARVPLTAQRLSEALGGAVSLENMTELCFKMVTEGVLERWGDDSFGLHGMSQEMTRNLLVTPEYQALGMDVFNITTKLIVQYIPREAEHRFFEVRKSEINERAGLGLFVRPSRCLPLGAIICEYVGRAMEHLPKGMEQGVYVVKLRTMPGYVDGITEKGQHLSMATFINDNGPDAANVELREYEMHAGRVFVVAMRDIGPGEEVLCTYGSKYWGFSSYDEIVKHFKRDAERKRPRSSIHMDEAELMRNFLRPCRRCGEPVVRRVGTLHEQICGDPLISHKLQHLNCLPYNDFTAVENRNKVVPSGRARALRRAKHFVDLSDVQTFALSHEDVIGDLTFSLANT